MQHPLGYPQKNDITTYGCRNGDVFLKGTLKGRLTIAADNNVDLIGNVHLPGRHRRERPPGPGGEQLRGDLPPRPDDWLEPNRDGGDGNYGSSLKIGLLQPGPPAETTAPRRSRGPGRASSPFSHSFRAQNYQYGDDTRSADDHVNGAIAQKYRGIVTLINSSGYGKNYNYDQRLKYQSPPHFLNPIAAAWQIVTWIEQKAACACNSAPPPAVPKSGLGSAPTWTPRSGSIVAGVFGLAVGSFLTVVVDRVPEEGVHRLAAVALPGLRRRDPEPGTTSPCSRTCCSAAAAAPVGRASRSATRSLEALTARARSRAWPPPTTAPT